MYLLINPNSTIQYIGIIDIPNSIQIDDSILPNDIIDTFALGKYTVVNGDIIETPNWTPPPPIPKPTNLNKVR